MDISTPCCQPIYNSHFQYFTDCFYASYPCVQCRHWMGSSALLQRCNFGFTDWYYCRSNWSLDWKHVGFYLRSNSFTTLSKEIYLRLGDIFNNRQNYSEWRLDNCIFIKDLFPGSSQCSQLCIRSHFFKLLRLCARLFRYSSNGCARDLYWNLRNRYLESSFRWTWNWKF